MPNHDRFECQTMIDSDAILQLAGMERWQWQDMPFWQVIAEASLAAREAGHAVREMERWMVPNKLREAA